jgi:hypothetical protein
MKSADEGRGNQRAPSLPEPRIVVQEPHRILKPGGIVYANISFVCPLHVDPDDY